MGEVNNKNQEFFYNLILENRVEINDDSTIIKIDGNKINNCINNLECVTTSENIKHSFDILPSLKSGIPIGNGSNESYHRRVPASLWALEPFPLHRLTWPARPPKYVFLYLKYRLISSP